LLQQAQRAEVAIYQSYPSSGQPDGPLRPAAPAPVLAAVKLMYAAAAVITVTLIISVTLIGGTKTALREANPGLTAAQVRDLTTSSRWRSSPSWS
jgi:hypothetical protein